MVLIKNVSYYVINFVFFPPAKCPYFCEPDHDGLCSNDTTSVINLTFVDALLVSILHNPDWAYRERCPVQGPKAQSAEIPMLGILHDLDPTCDLIPLIELSWSVSSRAFVCRLTSLDAAFGSRGIGWERLTSPPLPRKWWVAKYLSNYRVNRSLFVYKHGI